MPSTATITAFYKFTANTKARASYVNNNFSTFRGHIIAIDPNTATSATTETYDIGSTEYRWRTGYFRDVDFKSNTSTGQALQIIGDTAAGQGAFLIKHAGGVRARIGGGNQYIDINTTTSQFDFKSGGTTLTSMSASKWASNIPTSTGQWDFILNGSTLGTVKTGGWKRSLIESSSMIEGTRHVSAYNLTNSSVHVATLSITSNGQPIMIGINLASNTATAYCLLTNTISTDSIVYTYIYRDGTAASNQVFRTIWTVPNKSTTTSSDQYCMINNWINIDTSAIAGAHTYYLYMVGTAFGRTYINEPVFQARETL